MCGLKIFLYPGTCDPLTLVLYYTVKTLVLNEHQTEFRSNLEWCQFNTIAVLFQHFSVLFHHPSMLFQQCWKVLKYFFSNTAMVLNWHHSRLDLYWIQSGVNLLHRSFYSVGLIEYRRMTSQNFFLDFSVLDTMYRWSMIKNIHSPNWVGIGSRGPRDMAAWIPN